MCFTASSLRPLTSDEISRKVLCCGTSRLCLWITQCRKRNGDPGVCSFRTAKMSVYCVLVFARQRNEQNCLRLSCWKNDRNYPHYKILSIHYSFKGVNERPRQTANRYFFLLKTSRWKPEIMAGVIIVTKCAAVTVATRLELTANSSCLAQTETHLKAS